jgi:uncharacterized protein (TIGR02391 family)
MNLDVKPMTRTRVEDDGTVTTAEISADVHGTGKVFLAADADIQVGDELTYTLPNGKPRTIRITEHRVYGVGTGMDHTKCLYEDVTAKAPLREPTPVNLPGLHPSISAASGSKIASRHYDNAVFDAFKAVEERVQALTGNTLSGKPLMANVFNEQNPLLDITADNANDAQKADQREGYKFLFMGASQGLRNPRAHGADLKTDEHEAMEILSTASLLMRALDRVELRKAEETQRRMGDNRKTPFSRGLASGASGLPLQRGEEVTE